MSYAQPALAWFLRLPALAVMLALAASIISSPPAHAANPSVEMVTSMGTIRVELFADKAPKTVENFVQYTKDRFYDGTIFHRVIPGFMVQGGGFTGEMQQKKTRDAISNEAQNGLKNQKGTLAMARTPNPHSATAQFFINVADNEFLNFTGPTAQGFGYCVFGRVTQGMEIIDQIVAVPTGNRDGHQNVPLKPIVIQSVRIISSK